MKCFHGLSKLQSVKLDGCQVTYAAMRAIADSCESLKELSLSKCSGVIDEGLSYIARQHRQLKKVDITCCREISNSAIESIAIFCPHLTSLRMEACELVLYDASHLIGQHCQSLEDVNITENLILDKGFTFNVDPYFSCGL